MSRYLDLHAASWMEHHNYHLEMQMGTFSPPAAMTWTTLKGPPRRHGRCRFTTYFSLQELYCRNEESPTCSSRLVISTAIWPKGKIHEYYFSCIKIVVYPIRVYYKLVDVPALYAWGRSGGGLVWVGLGAGRPRNSWVRRRGPTSKQAGLHIRLRLTEGPSDEDVRSSRYTHMLRLPKYVRAGCSLRQIDNKLLCCHLMQLAYDTYRCT
jgi:hypothetical protein